MQTIFMRKPFLACSAMAPPARQTKSPGCAVTTRPVLFALLIAVSSLACGYIFRPLFLNSRPLDHLSPFPDIVLQPLRDFLPRAGPGLDTEFEGALLQFRRIEHLAQRDIERLDHLGRCTLRCEDRIPGPCLEIATTGFLHRWHVGQETGADRPR